MYIVVVSLYTTVSKFHLPTEDHERSYLRAELESLGLSRIRIDQLTNDSHDNNDIRTLVKSTKDGLLQEFKEAHK